MESIRLFDKEIEAAVKARDFSSALGFAGRNGAPYLLIDWWYKKKLTKSAMAAELANVWSAAEWPSRYLSHAVGPRHQVVRIRIVAHGPQYCRPVTLGVPFWCSRAPEVAGLGRGVGFAAPSASHKY